MLFIGWLILSFLNKEVLFCLYSLEAGALERIVKVYDRKTLIEYKYDWFIIRLRPNRRNGLGFPGWSAVRRTCSTFDSPIVIICCCPSM